MRLLSGGALATCVLAISTTACAQAPQAFDIPAGSLRDALNLYAIQSDQQIFFSGELVAGLSSEGLTGQHTPAAALDRLLAGSGLGWSETRPGVIYLRRAQDRAEAVEPSIQIEDVIVTGTLLRSSAPPSSPVVTLDRDDLDRRGFATVAEAIVDLPQNHAGSATPVVQLTSADRQGSNTIVSTGVNLRGLGPASTLVLINGRRLAGTGFRGEFADISALPSAAVERVDVLLDGASALYGADAVAGVINVILRRSYDGQESRLRIGAAQGGAEDVMASHLIGRTWSSGSAYVSYERQLINALSSLDRSYTADGDLRPFGGTDRRLTFSSPGNIVAFDPALGGFVAQYAIRPGPSGSAETPSDFEAGAANLQSPTLGVDLAPAIERDGIYARVRQTLGERLDLSADFRFNRREVEFAGPAPIALMTVTAANPHFVSPTGAASHSIGYSFVNDLGNTRQGGSSESYGVTAAASFDFSQDWSLEGYLAYAEEEGEVEVLGQVNNRFLSEALGVTPDNPDTLYQAAVDGFFNPFGAGQANGQTVLNFIGSGFSASRNHSRAGSANLLAQGPILELPGGELRIALGAQVRRETFETSSTSFTSSPAPVESRVPERERTIHALFAEASIPLVGAQNARPGIRRLDVSIAARFEDYSDFGTTTNPKIGIVWSPVDDLAVRTSWGTSFRAASLPQIFDLSTVSATFFARPDTTRVLSVQLSGGNPDLKPETAETFTVGFDFQPRGRFSISANYFDTQFTDRIARPVSENLTGVLSDPTMASFVTLVSPLTNPADLALVESYISRPDFAGTVYPATQYGAIVDSRWVNTGAVRVRGVDLSGAYPIDLGEARLTLDASASYVIDYESQVTPTAPVRQLAGQVGYPVRLRSRAGAVWSRGLGLALHWNHVDAYHDRLGARIESWDTADAQVSWAPDFGKLRGLKAFLTVQNVFDAPPPFYDAPTGYGFDPGQGNLFGRVVALQLVKRW
jgi:outer membrane receptor protein involved in Fe transport